MAKDEQGSIDEFLAKFDAVYAGGASVYSIAAEAQSVAKVRGSPRREDFPDAGKVRRAYQWLARSSTAYTARFADRIGRGKNPKEYSSDFFDLLWTALVSLADGTSWKQRRDVSIAHDSRRRGLTSKQRADLQRAVVRVLAGQGVECSNDTKSTFDSISHVLATVFEHEILCVTAGKRRPRPALVLERSIMRLRRQRGGGVIRLANFTLSDLGNLTQIGVVEGRVQVGSQLLSSITKREDAKS